MTDIFWALYWIDVLSSVPWALFAAALIGLVVAVGTNIYADVTKSAETSVREDSARAWRLCLRNIAIVAPIVLVLVLFVPDKKTMYMMLAVRTTDKAMQTETGTKLQRALNAKIDEYLKSLGLDTKEK